MTDDDDNLGIDLDAWQAPEPPSGIADAVIARMQTTHVGAPPVEPDAPRRRWWLLGGGLAAATAIAGAAIAVVVVTRAPESGQGAVVADRARRVELGPTSVALDPEATITWRRERHALAVEQRRGAATWHVGDKDTLTIDAALASIEANEANLRVEVEMKSETKQTIATSAATAAAVALVTVIVYDGSVKVTEQGTTKTVPAGVAYQIRASGPNVIEEQVTVAASTELAALEAELASKRAELEALKQRIDDQHARSVDPFTACDEVSCVLDNYEGACCAKWKKRDALPDSLGRAAIQRGIAPLQPKIHACNTSYTGKLSVSVKVAPDGSVTSAVVDPAGVQPAACITDVFRAAAFDRTARGGSFKYPFVLTASRSCAEDTIEQGKEAFSAGMFAAALGHFEQADACKPDAHTKRLAFAAACKLKNVDAARRYWQKLPESSRNQVLQLCVANGITYDDLNMGLATLEIQSTPAAKILVDGKEHGTTPLSITVAPGRHKVTFVVGDDKYTFNVTAKPGDVTSLVKDLR